MSENMFNSRKLNDTVSNNKKEMSDEDISFIEKIANKKEDYKDFIEAAAENIINLPDNIDNLNAFYPTNENVLSISSAIDELYKETIKIKYLNDNVKRLEKIKVGDWIDLYAAEDIKINQFESGLINLGVAMELPEGYEAHVLPRSSTFKKWGIIMTNSMGIIDNSYNGDNDWWYFSAFCIVPKYFEDLSAKGYTIIKAGDKIAQFRIMPNQPKIKFKEIKMLNNSDRGGFGSTGSV